MFERFMALLNENNLRIADVVKGTGLSYSTMEKFSTQIENILK